eukprot:Hpha_TRINITY_DN12414_c0_g1::TRINITY_DN12414_c0_g1_i1::g.42746::m.42746
MRMDIQFADTMQSGSLDESDDVLCPDSTWLDVKGLIKMWTSEPMSKQVLFVNGDEVDDHATLEQTGLGSQEALDKAKVVLGLKDTEEEKTPTEFSHEDFLKAARLAGVDAPVTKEQQREEEVRRERKFAQQKAKRDAPRSRPAALDGMRKKQHYAEGTVNNIFEKCWHGMRKEGTDANLAVDPAGVTQKVDHEGNPVDPFEYWDLRLVEDLQLRNRCEPGEIVLEIFYFGFHMPGKKASNGKPYPYITDEEEFKNRICKALSRNGLPVPVMDYPLRDAGCLYPLVACPARMTEHEAMILGKAVFDEFGVPPAEQKASQGKKGGGGGGGCAQQ